MEIINVIDNIRLTVYFGVDRNTNNRVESPPLFKIATSMWGFQPHPAFVFYKLKSFLHSSLIPFLLRVVAGVMEGSSNILPGKL
jgi:hypothetical protein